MLKFALLAVVVVLAALMVYVVTRPDVFRIERTASIKASPEKLMPKFANMREFATWSPWEEMDPAMQRTYGGPETGVGATYDWNGNKNIGSGRMEVLEAGPSRVLIKLDFFQPFEAHNMAEFKMVPRGDSTDVTWAMYGPNAFISKLMGLVFNMDKMVGGQFEKGLATLKTQAEN